MKILKKGKAPKPQPVWWVGIKITCKACGTFVQLEDLDDMGVITVTQQRQPGGTSIIEFICPLDGCRKDVRFEHSEINQIAASLLK